MWCRACHTALEGTVAGLDWRMGRGRHVGHVRGAFAETTTAPVTGVMTSQSSTMHCTWASWGCCRSPSTWDASMPQPREGRECVHVCLWGVYMNMYKCVCVGDNTEDQ